MKFVDQTEVRVRSGRGGPGLVSFRSAKNLPKLGADGGDGGFGGHVYLEGDVQLNTLSGLYYKKLYAAGDGGKGGPNGRTGKNGSDRIIRVPVGTVARNLADGSLLGEVVEDGQRLLIAEGGKRGLGNIRYLSSRHQAPEEHTSGGPSIEVRLALELKIIADVGLAGFPNAGKSTLLSTISAARPKVADYPFTTLDPQLGVVDMEKVTGEWGQSFVVADIPGLIEGASDGRGLGHEFLRHLERTKLICYVIDPHDPTAESPEQAFQVLQQELSRYGHGLVEKQALVILTKADLGLEDDQLARWQFFFADQGLPALSVSAVSGLGLVEWKQQVWAKVKALKEQVTVETVAEPQAASDSAATQGADVDEDVLGFS
jgi:GTP-binding protein